MTLKTLPAFVTPHRSAAFWSWLGHQRWKGRHKGLQYPRRKHVIGIVTELYREHWRYISMLKKKIKKNNYLHDGWSSLLCKKQKEHTFTWIIKAIILNPPKYKIYYKKSFYIIWLFSHQPNTVSKADNVLIRKKSCFDEHRLKKRAKVLKAKILKNIKYFQGHILILHNSQNWLTSLCKKWNSSWQSGTCLAAVRLRWETASWRPAWTTWQTWG